MTSPEHELNVQGNVSPGVFILRHNLDSKSATITRNSGIR